MKNKSTMKDRSSTNENNDQKKSKEEKENTKQKQSSFNVVKSCFLCLHRYHIINESSYLLCCFLL